MLVVVKLVAIVSCLTCEVVKAFGEGVGVIVNICFFFLFGDPLLVDFPLLRRGFD